MALNAALVFYVQPISRYYYEQLEYDLRSGSLGASIKVGEFTSLADRMALRMAPGGGFAVRFVRLDR